jgi:hypothetical protein
MFHLLHEMMSMFMIQKLCEFIYVKLFKQIKFC